MILIDWLILIGIAIVIGFIAQAIAGYSAGGCIGSLVIGFIGALIGFLLARYVHLPTLFVINIAGHPFPIIWSIIGAIVFLVILRLITAPARRYP